MQQATTTKAIMAGVTRAVVADFGRDDLYVAEPPVGVALGQAHLDALRTSPEERTFKTDVLGRLLEITQIVEAVQSGEATLQSPQEARDTLLDLFDRIVANVAFKPGPLPPEGKQAYDRARSTLYADPEISQKTDAYQEFCVLGVEANQKDGLLLGLKAQLAKAAVEERVAIEAQMAALEPIVRELHELIDSLDELHGFSAAKAVIESAERVIDAVPASVTSLLEWLKTPNGVTKDPVTQTDFVPATFVPSALSDANWVPMRVTAEDLAKANGGSAIDGIESIEFEFQSLKVDRPWFWPALFENGRWGWKSASPAVSDGSADPERETLLPAYVYALVFARNLLVKRRRAENDAPPPVLPSGILLHRMLTPLVMAPATTNLVPLRVAQPAPRAAVAARGRVAAAAMVAAPAAMAQPMTARIVDAPMAVAAAPAERPMRFQATGVMLRPDRFQRERIAIFQARFSADGSVIDEVGQPVYGARVQIAGTERFTTTGPDGRFTLNDLGFGAVALEVTREGFTPGEASLRVPQSEPATVRVQRLDPCEITVDLVSEDTGAPYKGRAQLTVTTQGGTRIEAIDDRTNATLKLPAGRSKLLLTVPGAEAVTPHEQVLDLQPGERRAVSFTVRPAFVLEMRDVSLLAYVCRRVPASPRPA